MGLDLLGSTCDYLGFYSVRLPIFIIDPKWRLGFVLDVEALNGRKLCLEIHLLFGKFEFCVGRSQQSVYGFQNQPEYLWVDKKAFLVLGF